jgi:hypothetical protein
MDIVTPQKAEKSFRWKVLTIFGWYFLGTFVLTFVIGLLYTVVLMVQGHSSEEAHTIVLGTSNTVRQIIIITGMLSAQFSSAYVYKKSVVAKDEIMKIILWFLGINFVIWFGFSGGSISFAPFSLFLVQMFFNALIISLTFKRLMKNDAKRGTPTSK